jgi:hypothetical protein
MQSLGLRLQEIEKEWQQQKAATASAAPKPADGACAASGAGGAAWQRGAPRASTALPASHTAGLAHPPGATRAGESMSTAGSSGLGEPSSAGCVTAGDVAADLSGVAAVAKALDFGGAVAAPQGGYGPVGGTQRGRRKVGDDDEKEELQETESACEDEDEEEEVEADDDEETSSDEDYAPSLGGSQGEDGEAEPEEGCTAERGAWRRRRRSGSTSVGGARGGASAEEADVLKGINAARAAQGRDVARSLTVKVRGQSTPVEGPAAAAAAAARGACQCWLHG